jgi:predicted kinase
VSRPRIIVLVGLPGSGKSYWANEQKLPVLSSDAIREMLTGDASNQNANRIVFGVLRSLLIARIKAGAPVTCVDTTALTPRERRSFVRLAELWDCEIEAVFFDVPLEVCKARNQARHRVVPESVMDRFAARLRPPSVDEGFARVTVVR